MQSDELLSLIANRLPALVAYVGTDGHYRFVNSYYEETIGQAGGVAYAEHIRDVLGEKAYEIVTPNIRRALAGEFVNCAVELPTADGMRNFKVTYAPDRDDEGDVRGFLVLALDVTDEQILQHQLLQAQKMEALGLLAGGIAHDFNNVLAVVMGHLELILERPEKAESVTRSASAALRAADRGADLSTRLLIFSRPPSHDLPAIDVNEKLMGLSVLLRRTLGSSIKVVEEVADGLPPIAVDASELENVLVNLAVNARDAMPEGGTLTIATHMRDGPARPSDDDHEPTASHVAITVTDTGVGMEKGVRDKVFEPFFTTKGPGRGTGLGLYMVYAFAENAGGSVTIESEPGRGCTVTICLPPASEENTHLEGDAGEGEVRGRGERVLLVEDDHEVRTLVRGMLESLGYDVVSCADGAAGCAALDAENGFALVVSDVQLRGGLGTSDLAKSARAKRPGFPVLLVSGNPSAPGAEELSQIYGEILQKPFTRDELARQVRSAIEHEGSAGGLTRRRTPRSPG